MTQHTIVFLHANCIDGLVAAWSLGLDPAQTAYIEYDHGKPREAEMYFDLERETRTVDRVIAVDCFPEFIRDMAESVVVIDHHESARERLADRTGLTEVVFDTTHSAAVLAYQWRCPDFPIPLLNRYVEDRDIWKWELPHSKAISAYIGTKPLTFEGVEELYLDTEAFLHNLVIPAGKAVLAAQAQVVTAAAVRAARRTFDGIPCAVVNCTTNVSEVGHELLELTNIFIAFMWRIDGQTMNVSVRTHPNSPLKANEIAERFGGGGHPQAAGFHVPAQWPLPWLVAA